MSEEKKTTEAKPFVQKQKHIHELTLARPTTNGERAYTIGVINKDGMCLEILRVDGCWSIKCANTHYLVQGEGQAVLK
jgi:hypothetical protein